VRVSCLERLPEVEFNLRRGTSTNTYLLKVGGWLRGFQLRGGVQGG